MSEEHSRGSDHGAGAPAVVDLIRDWFHVPVVAAIFFVMLWIRLRTYDRFIRNGSVYFAGNDAWYHLRQVNYTIRHWPWTMPFDPWTGFPYGNLAGQFGTLYDQLIATAALVVGLGDPSSELVAKTLLVAPAVFGALTVIPTYLVARRVSNRIGAVVAAVILMLLPGTFLQRGLVGFADHNIAEPFFQGFAVLAFMIALTVAAREKPIWELVADRDLDALRRPLFWSALAGVAVALYMWVWPPGVLLVGIVGVYLVVQMTTQYVRGTSPEYTAFAGSVAMLVTTVLMLVVIEEPGFGVTGFSFLQPLFSFGVAAGTVFLAFLARQWEARDVDDRGYALAVGGILLVSIAVFAIVLPNVFGSVARNLLRTVGFSAGAETRTIGEAQPFLSPGTLSQLRLTPVTRIMSEYGFTFFTGLLAATWFAAKPLVVDDDSRSTWYVVGSLAVIVLLFLVPAVPAGIGDAVGLEPSLVDLAIVSALILGATFLGDYEPEYLFVLVWAVFITSAAFTQLRFNYYLAVVVAVMNAYGIRELLRFLDVGVVESVSDISTYQAMVVGAALLLVLTPVLVVPIGIRDTGNPQFDKSQTALQAANNNGPGDITRWDGTLDWMANETPEEGRLGGANNDMEYYGSYEYTDDYRYPDGAYGVMSWWDYGHWITVEGERIPNANPFQQNAEMAANYLLAPNETAARDVLASHSTEGERTRYVMVDWQMVTPGSKFGAPVTFYSRGDLSRSEFTDFVYTSDLQRNFMYRNQRYYDSLMVRLYEYHGSAMEPAPVVLDWELRQAQTQSGRQITVKTAPQGNASAVRSFDNVSAARAYVQQDGTAQVGGIGPYPQERVPALQHYRLVRVSNATALESSSYQSQYASTVQVTGVPYRALTQTNHNWVKAFERVPGATIRGSGAPPNTTVTARVQMQVPTDNSTFVYTQQAKTDQNGEFTMTLPYSTTGYDQYGPDNGYTNVGVRATGPYVLQTAPTIEDGNLVRHSANLTVNEGRVNGAQDGPKTVTLERSSQQLGDQNAGNQSGQGAGANETAPTGDGANESMPTESTNESATTPDGTNDSTAVQSTPTDSTPTDSTPTGQQTNGSTGTQTASALGAVAVEPATVAALSVASAAPVV